MAGSFALHGLDVEVCCGPTESASVPSFGSSRVPTAQGKQGKWQKKFPAREYTGNLEILPKHREFGNFAKTQGKQGIWFAQVVNSLILKLKHNSIFAPKISIFFFKLDKSAKSVLCM